jgi:fumarate reductase subunit C
VLDARLFLLQRVSAMLMAPLVLIHLAVMILAVRGGLDAVEILARTRGSWAWGGFYGLFVIAAAIHAAIGLRVIGFETLGGSRRTWDIVTIGIAALLALLGLRAVFAVVAS